jgi:hypothetical protein
MKKVSLFPFLLVIIGSLPGLFTHHANPVLTQSALARQIIPTATDCMARKWEYCSLTLTSSETKSKDGKFTVYADICYYQSTGCRRERILSEGLRVNSIGVYEVARAKAIAKLGEDGWEMFLVRMQYWNSFENGFYFRRPKM